MSPDIEVEITPADVAANRDPQLERAIGKGGLLALRPLMMATGKEIWQLTLLRQ